MVLVYLSSSKNTVATQPPAASDPTASAELPLNQKRAQTIKVESSIPKVQPPPVAHDPVGNDQLPPEARAQIIEIQQEMARRHEELTDSVEVLTDEFLSDPSPDEPSWKRRMEECRQSTLGESATIIHASFDRIEDLIVTMPERYRQAAALLWGDLVAQFFSLWRTIWSALGRVFGAVVQWAKGMWEQVKRAWSVISGARNRKSEFQCSVPLGAL